MANRVILPPKIPLENIIYSQFDFLSTFASATDSIANVISASALVYSGIDPNPNAIIFGNTFAGSVVSVQVVGGVVGVIYEVAVQAQLNSGQRPILRGYLAVVQDLP